jgi:hypothetical protein
MGKTNRTFVLPRIVHGCRVLFITPMLNVIMRLGLPGNSTLENRILAVDIASTLFCWDRRAAQDATQANKQIMPDAIQTPPPIDDNSKHNADGEHQSRLDVSRLTPSMNEMIANFLLRMAFVRCRLLQVLASVLAYQSNANL